MSKEDINLAIDHLVKTIEIEIKNSADPGYIQSTCREVAKEMKLDSVVKKADERIVFLLRTRFGLAQHSIEHLNQMLREFSDLFTANPATWPIRKTIMLTILELPDCGQEDRKVILRRCNISHSKDNMQIAEKALDGFLANASEKQLRRVHHGNNKKRYTGMFATALHAYRKAGKALPPLPA